MTLKQQIVGINNFLTRIYGKETRLSTLLADFGISDQEIQLLHERHQEQVVKSFLAALEKQITTRDQRYLIVKRRFGLDGRWPATPEVLSRQLGMSIARVQQLESEIIGDCQSEVGQRLLKTNLCIAARTLIGDETQPTNRRVVSSPVQVKTPILSHRMSAKWKKKPARQRKTSISSSNEFGLRGTDWDPPVIRHDPRKFTQGLTMCPHGVPKTRICAICDPEGFRKEMGDF